MGELHNLSLISPTNSSYETLTSEMIRNDDQQIPSFERGWIMFDPQILIKIPIFLGSFFRRGDRDRGPRPCFRVPVSWRMIQLPGGQVI